MRDWLGYLEHETPLLLGVYTANVGKGGCTIFAQIVYERTGVNLMGLPWCVTFVFGALGCPEVLGTPCAGVFTLARRMLLRGLWRGRGYKPRRGDIIFCSNTDGWLPDHIGIVESCDGETVTSIDGNTVDPSGTFPPEQGGAVARRVRPRKSPQIVGYAATGGKLCTRIPSGP